VLTRSIRDCNDVARASASLDQEIRQASGRQELLTNLPRVERVLPYMTDQRVCKRCGKKTVVFDYQESSQSDAEVAKYFVLVEEFSAKLRV
jgi:hypothetical protein